MLRRVLFALPALLVACATSIDPDSEILGARAGSDGGAEIDSAAATLNDSGSPPTDTGTSSAPDTATGSDSAAADTELPDTEPVDTGTPDTETPPSDSSTGGTVTFPSSTDTKSIKGVTYFWNKGDYVEGARTIGAGSITSITGTWDVTNEMSNSFPFCSGASLDLQVKVNGTTVGSVKVTKATGNSIPINLSFSAITGPTYTIRYECGATVASGCGQLSMLYDVSSLTLK